MDYNEADIIVKYSHAISELAKITAANNNIAPEMYEKYEVMRGLRDKTGKGVLCGLTEISEVTSWEIKDGARVPVAGALHYRGYDVKELVKNCISENRFGFEETVYLLLFGKLPNRNELNAFC